MKRIILGAAILMGAGMVSPAAAVTFNAGASQPWLTQIKLPANVWAGTSGGAGVLIGVVDTGIDATNAELTGRVSTLSACAAISFKCSNGVFDDEGHGTAVAAIAAGASITVNGMMSGVAPGASIISEKALSSSGSGTDADVANGLTRAADAGAKVINLSLSYIPTARVVAAMNYAAAKGATIVFAGGNDGKAINGGLDSSGLSATTLSHLVFAGSVNSQNVKSSFSNTPGTAYAGTVNGAKVSYASLWLMAPGENIVAPGIQYGKTAYGYWTGTSMAAPVISGALALLDKTWPMLFRNGTTAAVLFASATDLGAAGVDSTYGNGLLNLTAAFQPIGGLSAVGPTGQTIPLAGSSAGVVSSPTLGTLKGLGAALANYTVFDGFARNFTANLSALLSKPTTSPVSLSSLVYTPVWTNVAKLRGGGLLELMTDERDRPINRELGRTAFGPGGELRHHPIGFVAFTSSSGLVAAGGYGVSPANAFGRALFGERGQEGQYEIGASTALAAMASGGYGGSIGAPFGSRLRLAASWSSTAPDYDAPTPVTLNTRKADARSFAASYKVTDRIVLATTLTALDERNGLLGSAYTAQSAINLGDRHSTLSTGVTLAVDLGKGRDLVVDASEADTAGSRVSTGLISNVGRLRALGFGAVYSQSGVWVQGDRVSFTLRQPLQLVAGAADLAQTTVDQDGYSHTSVVRTALVGGPAEVDAGVSYGRNIGRRTTLKADFMVRENLYRQAGLQDAAFRLVVQSRF